MKNKLNIIFDFDSTLTKIEGIDELARMKNKFNEIEILTKKAMNGEASFEKIFEERLKIIKPNLNDLIKLSYLYEKNIVENSKLIISKLKRFCNIFIVSGGYTKAIEKTAKTLGIANKNIYGNKLIFDKSGNYFDFYKDTSLWKDNGKEKIIKDIKAMHPLQTILIGDGQSDLECKDVVELFICFTGVVEREKVVRLSSHSANNFRQVYKIITNTYPQFSSH